MQHYGYVLCCPPADCARACAFAPHQLSLSIEHQGGRARYGDILRSLDLLLGEQVIT